MLQDCKTVGNLIGQKILITEFPAFISLREAYDSKEISERSFYIATYVSRLSFVLIRLFIKTFFSEGSLWFCKFSQHWHPNRR